MSASQSPTPRDVYHFGPLVLDAAARVLTRDGEPVPLAPKAFDLLRILVASSGRVVKRRELMDALWPDAIVEEGNLDWNVSVLRKALASAGAGAIQTVRGQGYRFVMPVKRGRWKTITSIFSSKREEVPEAVEAVEDVEEPAPPLAAPPPAPPTAASGIAPAPTRELKLVDDRRYAVGEEIARGGLGRVRVARDVHLERDVAVKELLDGGDAAARTRFSREALITARLQHPGIVPIYDAGLRVDGDPFYAMRLMAGGRSLAEVIDGARTLEARLALLPIVLAAIETLAYAHSRRVIHRDIKPDNILVGPFGETVVIDWGLAKDLTEPADGDQALPSPYRAAAAPGVTVFGAVVGTPAYMSPEQAAGVPVDERADVYALGALLYHVLAGRPPFTGTLAELLLSAVSRTPPRLETLQPGLPEDLVSVVHKAMAREREARYPTARELAADLRAFQTGQLVGSHAYSPWTLARRFGARHRGALIVAAASLAALVITGALGLRSVVRERNRAEERSRALTLVQARTSLPHDPTSSVAWLKTYPRDSPERAQVRSIAADAAARGVARHVYAGMPDRVKAVAFSADERLLAAGDMTRTIRIWDVASGAVVRTLELPDGVYSALYAGDRFAFGGNAGGILVVDPKGGAPRTLAGHTAIVTSLAATPSGRTLLSSSADGSVRAWDLAGSGEGRVLGTSGGIAKSVAALGEAAAASVGVDGAVQVFSLSGAAPRSWDAGHGWLGSLAVSRDGKRLATFGQDYKVRVWDVATGEGTLLLQHEGHPGGLQFSPDGTLIASGSRDLTVRVTPVGGGPSRVFRGHTDDIEMLAFSPDGGRLASSSLDGTVRVVDLDTEEQRVLRGPAGVLVERVVFSATGRYLASGSQKPEVRLWDLRDEWRESETALRGNTNDVDVIRFTADGSRLLSGGHDNTLRVWDRQLRQTVLRGHTQAVFHLELLPGETRAVTASWDHTLREWDLLTGQSRVLSGHDNIVTGLVVLREGPGAVSSSGDGTARIWDLSPGREPSTRHVLRGHVGAVQALALSPDERMVATGGADRTVRLWEMATGGAVKTLTGHTQQVGLVAFSPDGKRLASAGWDGTVRLWELPSYQARVLVGHTDRVRSLTFSPDGAALATGSLDRSVRLWDVASGKSIVLLGHEGSVRQVTFSPNGRLLASGGGDATVRLWDAASGELRALRRYSGIVTSVVFSRDGTRLAAGGWDKVVHLCRLGEALYLPGSTEALLGGLTTATTDTQGTLATR